MSEKALIRHIVHLISCIKALIDHLKVNSRWPCPECDRPTSDAPLRINRIITEDGNEYGLGCSMCNNDAYISMAQRAIDDVQENLRSL